MNQDEMFFILCSASVAVFCDGLGTSFGALGVSEYARSPALMASKDLKHLRARAR
jgi:hypothetical protein